MKRHYINDLNREGLLDFLQDGTMVIYNNDFLRKACIEQLCHDSDANKYILKDGILYEKEVINENK